MKRLTQVTRTHKGFAPAIGADNILIGKATAIAIQKAFKRSKSGISLPLQEIYGYAVDYLNRKGLLNDIFAKNHTHDVSALVIEHYTLIQNILNMIDDHLVAYGKIQKRLVKDKKGNFHTSWELIMSVSVYTLFNKEVKKYSFITFKKLIRANVQKELTHELGYSSKIEGIDKEYLDALNQQHVWFRAPKFDDLELHEVYAESFRNIDGEVRYKSIENADEIIQKHWQSIKNLNGKCFPVNEALEPRGRASKSFGSMKGFNLYGKSFETQCFRMSDTEPTIAVDARQSMYAILGSLLNCKPFLKLTGNYGKRGLKDIYLELFDASIKRAFHVSVPRDVAKRPAQMLGYLAGIETILLNKEDGEKSIYEYILDTHSNISIKDAAVLFDLSLREQHELEGLMMLRDMVSDCQVFKHVIVQWRLPESSEYFYIRSSRDFIFDDRTKHKRQFIHIDDDGKEHTVSMYIEMIDENAKGAAILAAIIHSIDAWIKKKVSLDMMALGHKILVKHDEFIINKSGEEELRRSYAKWLAYIAKNHRAFLQEPLDQAGYGFVDIDEIRAVCGSKFGNVDPKMIENSRNGLAFEWEVDD